KRLILRCHGNIPRALIYESLSQEASKAKSARVVLVIAFLWLLTQIKGFRFRRVEQHVGLLHGSAERLLLIVGSKFSHRSCRDQVIVELISRFKSFGIHSDRRPYCFQSS